MARTFDRPTLHLLDRAREVDIETIKPNGMPRRSTVWLIVDGDDVFVRSWRGDRAHWYQSALDLPEQVTLHAGGRAFPVRVVWSPDDESVDRCSRGLERKYAGDPAVGSMVRPAVLGTTLRLEPR